MMYFDEKIDKRKREFESSELKQKHSKVGFAYNTKHFIKLNQNSLSHYPFIVKGIFSLYFS